MSRVLYVGLEHIEKDTGRLLGHGYSGEVKSTKTRFHPGDVLYGRLRPYLNKVYVSDMDGICSTDILVFPDNAFVHNKYLAFRLLSCDFVGYASQNVSGVQHPRVNLNTLSQFALALPPLPEQRRIVAKIEELFSQLDAGVEALQTVKAQLQRYRQAVLKHAFEGKLTAEWREAHKDELEPAGAFLERVEAEREVGASGVGAIHELPLRQGRRKKLTPLDTSELPELPEGWVYLGFANMAIAGHDSIRRGPFGSAIKKEYFVPSGYKVYQQKNVILNDFSWGDYFLDEEKFKELKRFELHPGDIAITCSGTIGRIAMAPPDLAPGVINQALLKLALDERVVLPKYFMHLFRSKVDAILAHSTRGSAMKNLSSVQALKALPFPVASLTEQRVVVEQIERHFSIADEIEKTVDRNLEKAERLRQGILKRAFEGRLVPQDPSDEPAWKLLERIKAEKGRQESTKKAGKRSKRERSPEVTQGRLL